MAGLGVGEGQCWVRGAAPGTLPLLCHGNWPWGRWLTQQPKLETELSAEAMYVGDACNEQDGRSKSGNDAGTSLLQHHPLLCCVAPALQWEAARRGVRGWSAASPAAPRP